MISDITSWTVVRIPPSVGIEEGRALAIALARAVGIEEGRAVGTAVGIKLSRLVGTAVGRLVPKAVATAVAILAVLILLTRDSMSLLATGSLISI